MEDELESEFSSFFAANKNNDNIDEAKAQILEKYDNIADIKILKGEEAMKYIRSQNSKRN